jgi:hypothetical protein
MRFHIHRFMKIDLGYYAPVKDGSVIYSSIYICKCGKEKNVS